MRFSLLEGGFSDSSFAFIVGNTQVPISSDLSECFKSESRRKLKSSSLKWSEHKEDVFPGVQSFLFESTKSTDRFRLLWAVGLVDPKNGYFMHTYSLLRVRHIATSRRNPPFWHFDLLHGIKWTFTKRNLPELMHLSMLSPRVGWGGGRPRGIWHFNVSQRQIPHPQAPTKCQFPASGVTFSNRVRT